MAYRVQFHPDAVDDLERMKSKDPQSHARIVVFFQEYLSDENLVHELANKGFQDSVMQIDRCTQLREITYDIWRIKLQGLDIELGKLVKEKGARRHFLSHRIVYAFDDRSETIWVLGIFKRDEFNYDPDEPNSLRIRAAYDSLRLPKIRYVQ